MAEGGGFQDDMPVKNELTTLISIVTLVLAEGYNETICSRMDLGASIKHLKLNTWKT